MTTLTIPDIDDDLARRLQARAAVHGRSIGAEVRAILADAVGAPEALPLSGNMADAIRAIIAPIGGVDLPAFPDQVAPAPPSL